MPTTAGPGLRERKKTAAMRRIQQVALDLFDAHGYDAVTVEQVAEAAEASPSSVYRYFRTKERLVLHDEYDPTILSAVSTELGPGALLDSLRQAVAAGMSAIDRMGPDEQGLIRRRLRYVVREPSVRIGMLREVEAAERFARENIAARTGLAADSLELRVAVAAIVAALVSAMFSWYERGAGTDLAEELDRTLAMLAGGLDLRLGPPDGDGDAGRADGTGEADGAGMADGTGEVSG